MTTDALTAFENDYLTTWTEPDPHRRREIIERVWTPDGLLTASSVEGAIEGVDAIVAHIGRVHDELIAEKGLTFVYDQHVESGEALLLRWSMLTPAGDTAGRGADVVFRDAEGRVTTCHMFMGVD